MRRLSSGSTTSSRAAVEIRCTKASVAPGSAPTTATRVTPSLTLTWARRPVSSTTSVRSPRSW
jgi:hypothetical protein